MERVTSDVKQRVVQQLELAISKLREHYHVTLPMPFLKYDLKGTTAGTANYITNTIRFNPTLLMENIELFIARTVLHELGHIACDRIYPEAHQRKLKFDGRRMRRTKRDVHGERWQEIMRVLGGPTSRCHSYDVSSIKSKRSVQIACGECHREYSMGFKRYKRFLATPSAFWCKCQGGYSKPHLHVVQKPQPVVQTIAAHARTGTKMAQCAELFKIHGATSERRTVIEMFIQQCGCTPVGAQTYYNTLKNKLK